MITFLKKNDTLLLLTLLIAISVFIAIHILFQSRYAPGWDSYFYMLQIKSWFEIGELHSPRINIIYPLLIAFQYFVDDYVLAYKLVSLVAYSSFISLVFTLAKIKTKNTCVSLGIAALVMVNPQLIYFTAQFTKNLIGLNALLLLIIALEKKNILTGIISFVICGLAHKLIFGLAIIYGTSFLFYTLISKRATYLLSVSLFVLPFISYFLVKYLLPSQFSETIQLPFISFYESHKEVINTSWIFYGIGASLLFILFLIYGIYKPQILKASQYSLLITLSILSLPFLKWGVMEFSFRFWLVFGITSPLLLLEIKKLKASFLVFFALVLGAFSYSTYSPKLHDPPYLKYAYIANAIQNKQHLVDAELLISHKSLAEYISYQVGIDVLPWGIEEGEVTEDTFRLVYIGVNNRVGFLSIMEEFIIQKVTSEYVLVKEKDWLNIKPQLMKELNYFDNWRNPYLIR